MRESLGSAPGVTSVQTILAFDFGLKRIGVASGDTLTGSAGPRAAIAVSSAGPDWSAIEREVRALQPHLLIVGAPYNADGSPGALASAASAFAAELARRFALPVKRVDERYSSLQASERLKAQRASGERRRRIRREDIDSAAAAIILERWLAGEAQER
ncbi:MAG TPA: Holliday junction resolvase RuvX [Steroidobacteraceae bacterium]|jgi:putative Holliday junction resolvase|nr:Holliday junction resolvase RuvX [Steroidobacteraceae bacterium]